MDPTTLTIGGLAGGLACFYAGMRVAKWGAKEVLRSQHELIEAQQAALTDVEYVRNLAYNALMGLRQTCFITNERGHRVRYVNASQEARAKAEGN